MSRVGLKRAAETMVHEQRGSVGMDCSEEKGININPWIWVAIISVAFIVSNVICYSRGYNEASDDMLPELEGATMAIGETSLEVKKMGKDVEVLIWYIEEKCGKKGFNYWDAREMYQAEFPEVEFPEAAKYLEEHHP